MPRYTRIIGSGSYLPPKILTNHDLESLVDTTDEWIVKRTGINKRHLAVNEATSDLAIKAGAGALRDFDAQKVEAIIVATTTADYTFPSTASLVQAALKCSRAFAFDVQAVCSGFVYALAIADSFIRSGQIQNALIIGADSMSKIVDWQDRNTCVLFGDGAGAMLVEIASEPGIIASNLYSDGNLADILCTSGGISKNCSVGTIIMKGSLVFEHAIIKLEQAAREILQQNDLEFNDIDYIILHQANLRIIKSLAERLKIPLEKFSTSITEHANTSAASIPLAFDVWPKKHMTGQTILLLGIGGGMTWGASLIKI